MPRLLLSIPTLLFVAVASLTGSASAETVESATGNECLLSGAYAYRNVAGQVASFGVIRFDGEGKVSMTLRINVPGYNGSQQRQTLAATGLGSYQVGPDGIGTANVEFSGISVKGGIYDFVATRIVGRRATEVFAVLRHGGVKGQLVDPVWTLLKPNGHGRCAS
jgi:hypothetical protein